MARCLPASYVGFDPPTALTVMESAIEVADVIIGKLAGGCKPLQLGCGHGWGDQVRGWHDRYFAD